MYELDRAIYLGKFYILYSLNIFESTNSKITQLVISLFLTLLKVARYLTLFSMVLSIVRN
jgi:hypothetical protein